MGAVRIDLFTEESNIMDRGFWLVWTIVLFLTNMHLFTITDGLWIILMCLSTVWTLILTAPIHCRASIGEQVMQ